MVRIGDTSRTLLWNRAGNDVYYAAAELPWAARQQRPRALVYTLEAGGALGGVVACVGVYGLAFMLSLDGFYPVGEIVLGASLVGLPFASGYGTYLAGDAIGEDGTAAGAIIGAWVGVPVALGFAFLAMAADLSDHHDYVVPGIALAVLTFPAGAVVGYNLSMPNEPVGVFGKRLQAPGVTFTSVELPDHSVAYGVRVQLAGLRF
jgi:hypothetical protein